MSLIIPQRYKLKLLPETTEMAIKMLKDAFQERLAKALNLRRVTAPLFVLSGTGLNDDLNGSERAVSFPIADMGGRKAEVVHSLAKWKRVKLGAYDIAPGFGLYTDMNAIRTHEELDNLHSLYVDQWDWEKTITREDRNLEYLKQTVRSIYSVIKECESLIYAEFPHITPLLPDLWPQSARGVGLTEAPRGALAHYVNIEDKKVANYQMVVPTTWNASPRDTRGQLSAFEASLIGTPVADPQIPLEIIRTIHSFDPCMACAVHLYDKNGEHIHRCEMF